MLPVIECMLRRVFTHDTDVYKREIAIEAAEIGLSPEQICLGGLGLGTKNRAGLFGRCLGKFQVPHRHPITFGSVSGTLKPRDRETRPGHKISAMIAATAAAATAGAVQVSHWRCRRRWLCTGSE